MSLRPPASGLRNAVIAMTAAAVAAFGAATPATAAFLGLGQHKAAPVAEAAPLPDADIAAIQRAIDEQRYVDAGRLLDVAIVSGAKDSRIMLLAGDLNLARGRYDDALACFKQVEADAGAHAKSLEGQGIALSLLGHSDDALAMLQKAVAADPTAWRAWNALGGEYDSRRDWAQAETAYDHAIADSNAAPIVLNNRGFSRLLQNRLDEAVADFVVALQKKPDLAAARTNLRLAMAMKGDYDRASVGGAADDRAALLNNAGFAAMVRGDYTQAEALFTEAMKAKGEYYARASANLEMARSLAARETAPTSANH
jgi:Flp pilus assembly protein TadD